MVGLEEGDRDGTRTVRARVRWHHDLHAAGLRDQARPLMPSKKGGGLQLQPGYDRSQEEFDALLRRNKAGEAAAADLRILKAEARMRGEYEAHAQEHGYWAEIAGKRTWVRRYPTAGSTERGRAAGITAQFTRGALYGRGEDAPW